MTEKQADMINYFPLLCKNSKKLCIITCSISISNMLFSQCSLRYFLAMSKETEPD